MWCPEFATEVKIHSRHWEINSSLEALEIHSRDWRF